MSTLLNHGRTQLKLSAYGDYTKDAGVVLRQMVDEIDDLRKVCRDAYEVWAGSEGIPEPKTAAEAYLLQLLMQMRDEVKKGL